MNILKLYEIMNGENYTDFNAKSKIRIGISANIQMEFEDYIIKIYNQSHLCRITLYDRKSPSFRFYGATSCPLKYART